MVPTETMLTKRSTAIDWPHKSYDELNKYPKMHHFVTKMCTHVYMLLQNGALWDWCILGLLQQVYYIHEKYAKRAT